MWKNYEVDKSNDHKVAICQSSEGRRYFELVEASVTYDNPDLISMTDIVPYDLLFRKAFEEILESSNFNNGMVFGVDSHGIWLTQDEISALKKGIPDEQIQWFNGMPPNFPKR